jgi:hypothetical protein
VTHVGHEDEGRLRVASLDGVHSVVACLVTAGAHRIHPSGRAAHTGAARPGIGYRDLAADMIGYAEIYEQHKKGVASDTTNYRASDLPDARRLAGEILSHLSAAMTPRARQAYEQLQRAWMLLLDVYAELREAGRWLLRRDPAREDRFPSLVTPGRTAAVRAPKAPKAAPKKEGGEQAEDG